MEYWMDNTFGIRLLLFVILNHHGDVKWLLNRFPDCNEMKNQPSHLQTKFNSDPKNPTVMKTMNFFRLASLAFVFVCFAAFSAHAGSPIVNSTAEQLQKVITDGIKYPEKAVRSCCTGTVDVTFTVDETGKINVEKTSSDNAKIEKMVKEQLSGINCKDLKVPTFEHYKVKIHFRLVG